MQPMRRSTTHLLVMCLVTSAVFLLGAAQKSPCASTDWIEGGVHRPFLCESDLPHMPISEQLTGDRRPYLDACEPAERPCDEYPPLTMYALRAIASVPGQGDPYTRFYAVSVALLLLCALAITWSLEQMGARTILFAAAPVLLTTGTTSLDLLPVALATLGTLAYLRRRNLLAGFLLGVGAVAKIYPALLAFPFGIDAIRRRDRRGAARLGVGAVTTTLAGNLPFAVAATASWFTLYRLNASRPADYETLWHLAARLGLHVPTAVINAASLIAVLAGSAWIGRSVLRRHPNTPAWMLAFPLLVLLLLTGKVWSSQYSLWLLPWFALGRIRVLPFLQYQLAEVAEFLIRYLYFATVLGGNGLPYAFLGGIVVIRAALLTRCLVLWIRDPLPAAGVVAREPRRT